MGYQYHRELRAFHGLPPDDGDSSEDEDAAFVAYAMGLLPDAPRETTCRRYSVCRTIVKRIIREGWQCLRANYFDPEKVYPDAYFRRRYRVSPGLFVRIADAVIAYNDYFQEKENVAAKMGCHPYQKIMACFKMLATGCSADSLDAEFRMSRTLIIKSMKLFIQAVVHLFGDRYLRAPNSQDIECLLQTAKTRGFPGMIVSIDCMHWVWEKCPVAWHGEHRGHIHKPTFILEAVAGPNLWIWHAFFGLPGSLNDINVLHRSPVFDDLASRNAPRAQFNVNGNSYDMGYYLADGIYPDWATLIKGVHEPLNDKQKLFTLKQAAYKKDVERAFGVLQAKFAIVKGPAKLWHVQDLKYIMRCCVILHNMAVEDERGLPEARIKDFENATVLALLPKNVPTIDQLIANHKKIESRVVHSRLQEDLMEHVWAKFGNNRGNHIH